MKIYGTTFKRDGVTVSQIGDYLKACGIQGVFTTQQAIADAVEATAGLPYQAELDWRAFKRGAGPNGTDLDIEGMDKFPVNPETGERQSWLPHPTEKDENGNPTRIFANLYIRNFIAQ